MGNPDEPDCLNRSIILRAARNSHRLAKHNEGIKNEEEEKGQQSHQHHVHVHVVHHVDGEEKRRRADLDDGFLVQVFTLRSAALPISPLSVALTLTKAESN